MRCRLALSLAGYTYHPWNDSISWGLGNQPNVTTYAFEHYRRNIDGGKPEYNRRIETWEQDALWYGYRCLVCPNRSAVCVGQLRLWPAL